MGDETNTGGGAHIGGDANTGGGNFAGRDYHDHRTYINPAQSANLPTPHQIPAPPADFTGRGRELAELRAAVAQGKSIAIVQGQGGTGKTALAYALAQQVAGNYPGGQLFVDLQGTQGPLVLIPEQALGQVIHSYLPEIKLPDGLAELQNLYRSLLGERRVLVLFDNARDAAQVEPLLPLPPGCLALVTTRQRVYLPGLFEQHLDALPPADAEALILSIASRAADCAPALARTCGYLPLALRAAAALLHKNPLLSPPNLLERLNDAGRRLKLTGVEAALSVSYDKLPPDLQEKWRRLAVFAGDFDAQAAAAVWGVSQEAAQDALGELYSYAMLELKDSRCLLHDLARDYAAQRMNAEEALFARLAHARYFLQVLMEAEELYLHGNEQTLAGLALFDRERDEIAAGQAWAAAAGAGERERLDLCKSYPGAGPNLIQLRLHPREQIAWIEAALRQARAVNDIGGEGAYLTNLGNAYWALGETRHAVECYEQGLLIHRKTGHRRNEGNTLSGLGSAYAALGENQRAIQYYEQALTIRRETGDRRGEGGALAGLGIAYAALGETRRAIDLYEQALVIRRDDGGILTALGAAYTDLGETRRAINLYEQALVIHRETGDRRSEGGALTILGSAYAALGETHRAIDFYEQALVIHHETGDRRNEGNTLSGLGSAYTDLGEIRRAIDFYEQALFIHHETGNRRGEGSILTNLGIAYAALGEARRAIDFYEQALSVFRETGDRRAEGTVLDNLGVSYGELGEISQAIEHFDQALVIDRETGDRRGEGSDLGNLGAAYAALGETRRAIDFYEQALVFHRETGDRHGEGIALGNLGEAWLKLGEAEKAAALCQQALEISRQVENQRNVGYVLTYLGNACLALGQVEQGFAHLNQALQILRDLGDRQGQAEAAWHLGQAYLSQGERARALEYLQIRVDYEREIGHAQAEQHAAEVEAIRSAAG